MPLLVSMRDIGRIEQQSSRHVEASEDASVGAPRCKKAAAAAGHGSRRALALWMCLA